jgi:hypothetical protein
VDTSEDAMTRDELLVELEAAVNELVTAVENTARTRYPLQSQADWDLLERELENARGWTFDPHRGNADATTVEAAADEIEHRLHTGEWALHERNTFGRWCIDATNVNPSTPHHGLPVTAKTATVQKTQTPGDGTQSTTHTGKTEAMNVRELIEELSKCDPELPVFSKDVDYLWVDVDHVTVGHTGYTFLGDDAAVLLSWANPHRKDWETKDMFKRTEDIIKGTLDYDGAMLHLATLRLHVAVRKAFRIPELERWIANI